MHLTAIFDCTNGQTDMVMNSVAISSLKSPPRKATPTPNVVFGSDALMGATLPVATKGSELLKDLPSLTALVLATSQEERAHLNTKLGEIAEMLNSLTQQPGRDDDEATQALKYTITIVDDRITRGLAILQINELPQDIRPLSPEEQIELAHAMDQKRHAFWTKLYEVPFVQQEAIATLESLETKQAIIATIIFPLRTDEYRYANKSARNAMLKESVKESLQQIRDLGEHVDAGIGSDYRRKVATILARTPLAPENALALASACKRKAQSLIDAEVRSSAQDLPEGYHALRADFGASALHVRGFISELTRLEEPYILLKNYMVMSVANLARSVINRTTHRITTEKTDLFQSGVVGIMRGVERFDPGYGTQLTTHVFNWITQAVRVERSVGAFAVSVPLYKQADFFKVRTRIQNDEESTRLQDIAAQQGVSAEDARAFTALLSPARSLDYRPENSMSLNELVADKTSITSADKMDRDDLKYQLSLAFQRLNATENKIVSMFYGLNGMTSKSDAEISAEIGMRTDQVKSIRARSLARLQRDSTAQGINELYGAH